MGSLGVMRLDLVLVSLLTQLSFSSGNHYDVRCKCVCPNPGIINLNTTDPTAEERRLYIRNVAPSHCDCLNVVIPSLYVEHHHVTRLPEAFCPRCVCRYEQRNTTIIKVVVSMIICIIGLLTLYMGYFFLIDPIFVKWKQNSYRQQKEEEEREISPESDDISTVSSRDNITVMTTRRSLGRSAALQRIGSQQDKWKQQVQEQRTRIYDQHTMLN